MTGTAAALPYDWLLDGLHSLSFPFLTPCTYACGRHGGTSRQSRCWPRFAGTGTSSTRIFSPPSFAALASLPQLFFLALGTLAAAAGHLGHLDRLGTLPPPTQHDPSPPLSAFPLSNPSLSRCPGNLAILAPSRPRPPTPFVPNHHFVLATSSPPHLRGPSERQDPHLSVLFLNSRLLFSHHPRVQSINLVRARA